MSDPRPPRKLTTQQVADRFGVTRATVQNWANAGLIAHTRTLGMGNRPGDRRFDPELIEALVRDGLPH